MREIKVGVQIYSVRENLAKDFIGTLKKVREIGYDYVEFAGNYGGYTGGELKKILDDIGLKSISVHQNIDMFVEQGKAAFDFFKAYGVHYIVIPWYNWDRLPGSPEWEATREKFISVAKQAQENGMELLYHNHDFEFVKLDGECKYDIMFRELAGYVDPEPDVCWIHYGGQDPSAYLRKYGDRINVVHLKDFNCSKLAAGPVYELIGDSSGNSKEDSGFAFAPLGQGRNNFDEILSAVDEIGAEYVIVEQDASPDIPLMEAIEISRKYLKEKFGI